MVLIKCVGGGSSRYNVSFVESESISKTVLKNADGDDTIKADINDGENTIDDSSKMRYNIFTTANLAK
jgi:hypothetical protein